MVVGLKNGQLHGKAILKDQEGVVIAQFSYKNGNGNGKCSLYYPSGKLFFCGYLVNGYRDGLGIEYDEKGDVMYEGFFTKGMRNYRIIKYSKKEGYWEEMSERAVTVSICHKDKHGRNDGICYFYSNSSIDHISKWKKGKEVEVLHVFDGDLMESFEHGEVVYHGQYHQISPTEILPKFEGENSTVKENCSPSSRKKKEEKKKKSKEEKLERMLDETSLISICLSLFFAILIFLLTMFKGSVSDAAFHLMIVILSILSSVCCVNSVVFYVFSRCKSSTNKNDCE